MIKGLLLDIAIINWIAAMVLMVASNTSTIISKTNYERKGWNKYRMGYTIKEMKEVIELVDDELIKKKVKRSIIFRRTAYWLFISTPILIILGNL